jgi:hypothetical protein
MFTITVSNTTPPTDDGILYVNLPKKRKNEEDLVIPLPSPKAPKLSELAEQRRLVKEAKRIALEEKHTKELDERFTKAQTRINRFLKPTQDLTDDQMTKLKQEFKDMDESLENGAEHMPDDYQLYMVALMGILDPTKEGEDEDEDEDDETTTTVAVNPTISKHAGYNYVHYHGM